MAKTAWPGPDRREHIGSWESRIDGPWKATGNAKYAYDINRKDMLYGKLLGSRYGNAKLNGVDTSEAEAMDGVETVWVASDRQGALPQIEYAGQIIAAVAARTEEIANEAIRKIKVDYSVADAVQDDRDISLASGRDQEKTEGDPEAGFAEADKTVEGHYGLPMITHCCLEAHGQVCEFGSDGDLYVWPSTQNVSGYAGGLTRDAELPADRIHVDCQVMGGGFGSKFASDEWGSIAVTLAKQAGKPVKLMLDRDMELEIAGNRPSAYADVKVGVKNDGAITAWESTCWGTGGIQRWRMPPIPYAFNIANQKTIGRGIVTNRGATRAWRAPNHPQACLITMSAMEDAAAAIGMDALEFFRKNLHLTDRPEVYAEEFDIAAQIIGYNDKKHPRGEGDDGPVKRGLGCALHFWGGQGHPSACDLTINPDGSVIARIGTQDLGTGTRTAIALVVADSLGLDPEQVRVEIGKNQFPPSGASGGSTTIGGISSASRDASVKAVNALIEKVAAELDAQPDELEAWDGKVGKKGDAAASMSWKEACDLLGQMPITVQGKNPPEDGTELTTGGVGGVQIADVSVDTETGIVTINEVVAVQDIGLIVNMKAAESQVYGALIMGITYALYEETIYDPMTGVMLNPDMEFYRLAGFGDIGKLHVHLMNDEKYAQRGVIGLGEPPVISPGAAISNAVANACGVRVPELPLTPDRVLAALEQGGKLS